MENIPPIFLKGFSSKQIEQLLKARQDGRHEASTANASPQSPLSSENPSTSTLTLGQFFRSRLPEQAGQPAWQLMPDYHHLLLIMDEGSRNSISDEVQMNWEFDSRPEIPVEDYIILLIACFRSKSWDLQTRLCVVTYSYL